MLQSLVEATPELSPKQRQLYFGARSNNEQQDLADLFNQATPQQRSGLYSQLSQMLADSLERNN